ncbi:MAG: heparan-alpha-glucosaminide N-acetyltransferase domain-containing protein [Pirellulaceae bacterium]|jgi:predicted acyltransferase|nr:heparan-alpha-glucosaminide N-acetyltransferase domain-containing protein [Pirellulaceae bacterium]
MSLDALRGFNMFWIVGADALVAGLRAARDNTVFQDLAYQLEHVAWEGFHFEDLIFPMFVFIVGVSLVYSLSRTIEEHGRRAAVMRIVRRSLLLYLLGIFYYGGFNDTFEQIRLLGVLQRIALCYLGAGLIFCFWGLRGRIAWCVGLLVGYWLVLSFVPVPGGTAGNFAEGQNLANWVDKEFLPLRKWDGDHDPEGLLSTLPAIANCLIGVLVGMLIRDSSRREWQKVAYLIVAGGLMAAAGWGWNEQFPVIKKIWTSSFVLVACGYSCILFALFHLVIEICRFRIWAQPLVWIGMNPITIYLLVNLVDIEAIAQRLVGGQLNTYLGSYGQLAIAIVGLLLVFGVAGFLYRRKIFLRL